MKDWARPPLSTPPLTPEGTRRAGRPPTTRVSVKGQVVVPRAIRRLLNISTGSRLLWETDGRMIRAYPVSQEPVGASAGTLAGLGLTLEDFLDERQRLVR